MDEKLECWPKWEQQNWARAFVLHLLYFLPLLWHRTWWTMLLMSYNKQTGNNRDSHVVWPNTFQKFDTTILIVNSWKNVTINANLLLARLGLRYLPPLCYGSNCIGVLEIVSKSTLSSHDLFDVSMLTSVPCRCMVTFSSILLCKPSEK